MNDRPAVRHYVDLAQLYGDPAILTAYRRTRDRGVHADPGRSFHLELERLTPKGGGAHSTNRRRLAAIRIERRAVAVALFSGEELDSVPLVRQLSSDGDKALGSAAMFIRRILENRPFPAAAMEVLPPGDELQRTQLDRVIAQVLAEASAISIWRVPKRDVIRSFGQPPLRFRAQVRETIEHIFPESNGSFGVPIIGCVNNIRNAAIPQQFHERQTFEAEFVGSLARRDSAVRKKGQNCLFAQMCLKAGLVGGIVGNVDLDLQLHGIFIVPL